MIRLLLATICFFFLANCNTQNEFPVDLLTMGLNGKVKTMRQISNSKGAQPFRLEETYYFDEEGNLERIEHHTLPQANIETKSMGRETIFTSKGTDTKVAITFGDTDSDTVRTQLIELLNAKKIRIIDKQHWNDDYESEIIQSLDNSKRLVEVETTVFKGKPKEVLFEYTHRFVYDGDLVKEIIIENDNEESKMSIENENLDDYGNFTYRVHRDENGAITYTEQRMFEYY